MRLIGAALSRPIEPLYDRTGPLFKTEHGRISPLPDEAKSSIHRMPRYNFP
jgi:hypothetical protein